jgi:hypothetical protein
LLLFSQTVAVLLPFAFLSTAAFPSPVASHAPPIVATLTRAATQSASAHLSPVRFNCTFSVPVTGVSAALFTAGSTVPVGAISVTAIGSLQYLVSVPVTAASTCSVRLSISNLAPVLAAVQDLAGFVLLPSALDATVQFDSVAPQADTFFLSLPQTNPVLVSPVVLALGFSEDVTGVSAALFAVSGSASVGAGSPQISGSGSGYSVSIPIAVAFGSLTVSLSGAPASVVDLFGNPLSASAAAMSVSLTFGLRPPCPSLVAPANGAVNTTQGLAGDAARFTCTTGFELRGPHIVVCNIGSFWTPISPSVCLGASCLVCVCVCVSNLS